MSIENQIENFDDNASVEDIQDKVKMKLANIFSFYNEQEFLDEINGMNSDE